MGTNHVLDHDDEIVTYLDVEKGGVTTLGISWSEAGTGALPNPAPVPAPLSEAGVKVSPDEKTPHVELWLETEQFRLGMNAEGIEDPAALRMTGGGTAKRSSAVSSVRVHPSR